MEKQEIKQRISNLVADKLAKIIDELGKDCSEKFGDKELEDGLQTLLLTMLQIDFPRRQVLAPENNKDTYTFEFMNPNGRKIKNVKIIFEAAN